MHPLGPTDKGMEQNINRHFVRWQRRVLKKAVQFIFLISLVTGTRLIIADGERRRWEKFILSNQLFPLGKFFGKDIELYFVKEQSMIFLN